MNLCVVPAYNCETIIERSLGSIAGQRAPFRCVIVDDASSDNTADRARAFIAGDARFAMVVNTQRRGPLYSRMQALAHARPDDDDLVFLIDGDDFLIDDEALGDFANIADQEGQAVLYGDFLDFDGTLRQGAAYTREVISARSFRAAPWRCHPLRAFRSGLVKHIDPATHFMRGDTWIVNSSDKALMFCLLELAHGKIRHIPGARYQVGMKTRSGGRGSIFSRFLVARMPPVPERK